MAYGNYIMPSDEEWEDHVNPQIGCERCEEGIGRADDHLTEYEITVDDGDHAFCSETCLSEWLNNHFINYELNECENAKSANEAQSILRDYYKNLKDWNKTNSSVCDTIESVFDDFMDGFEPDNYGGAE